MSESDSRISYLPNEGTTYDPEESKYWDASFLRQEINRAFEICHGCRMCFKYCDSFPDLFRLIDEKHDGRVSRLLEEDIEQVMDSCFQCKLCEVQCPYTPSDGHEFQLDFPKLVHRYKAQKSTGKNRSLRDRFLGDPDGTAKLARKSLGFANLMNRNKMHRIFMEKVLGIHREKQLPDFSSSTFEKQVEKMGRIASSFDSETVLFQTCYVQNNEPEIGLDTLEVLDNNQVECSCVKGLQCCGMPAWEQGKLEQLRSQARNNLELLMPFVEKGSKILVVNPTCSMMMKREYPELLGKKDRPAAEKLSASVQNPAEYLWNIRQEERFNRNFKSTPGSTLAYHAPCHLRTQRAGFRGMDLLKLIPGVSTKMIMECCGHDGTYAMKTESFEASCRIGEKAFVGMQKSEAKVWATDCPLAAIQFEQHADRKPLHPMSILARAYKEEGFPEKIQSDAKENHR